MTHTAKRTMLHRDERGFSLVTIGLSLMALFGATMLAIDVGMLMWARTQAQVSADAGALSGATALAFNSFTNRTPTGPAVTSALSTAQGNQVQGQAPSVIPADVTFPTDPVSGLNNQVQVMVHRTTARSNPLPTFIATFFGMATADVTAVATAATYPADAATCVLPFTIPDKWQEHTRCGAGTCTWQPTDTYEILTPQGNHTNVGPGPMAYPDVYVPPGDAGNPTTGYDPVRDKGVRLVLKQAVGDTIAPSFFNPIAIPTGTGADYYRENIMGCNTTILRSGTLLTPEPGAMTGPTQQGLQGLVDLDPGAYWEDLPGCNCIKGSNRPGMSPRVRPLPLFNPERYARTGDGGRSQPTLELINYLGFFVERMQGNEVIGRIHPINGVLTNPTNPYEGGFAQAIMLVK